MPAYFPTYQPAYYTPAYQPAQYQPPQQQQTQMTAPAQLQPPTFAPINTANQSAIIWVNGKAEADAYPVAPNAAVSLWDSSAPCIYLKKADASGRPTMTIYDLVERVDAPAQPTTEQTPPPDYATKQEVEAVALAARDGLDGIKKELRKLKKKMEADDE